MFARINGIRMACFERGRQRSNALLLIHGFPLDHRLWHAQLRGLGGEVRAIAPDLRGHGRSASPGGPLSMDRHADDMAALLDHLGIARAVVAGLSMGGYVAFSLWRRHPGRVQGLILLDTRAEPDAPAAKLKRDATAAQAEQMGAAIVAEEMLPRLLAPRSLANPKLVAQAWRLMSEQPVAGIVGALQGLRDRQDSRPTLATITVPTLVLVGEADAITPPADGAAMASAIDGAGLVVIPGAGHLSPLENPRAVNAALRTFLRGIARVS
jgi:pimeloyl-ACP methyl ester carboxylesterase